MKLVGSDFDLDPTKNLKTKTLLLKTQTSYSFD